MIREYVRGGAGDNEHFIAKVMRAVRSLSMKTDYITFIKENWRFLRDKKFLRFCAGITLLILFLGGGHSVYFLSSHADSSEIVLYSHDQYNPGDKISGKVLVFNAVTKKPVEGAEVIFKLKKKSGDEILLPDVVKTGEDGTVSFDQPIKNIAQGEYQLIAITGRKNNVKAEADIRIASATLRINSRFFILKTFRNHYILTDLYSIVI